MGQPWRKHEEEVKWTEKYSEKLKVKIANIIQDVNLKPTLLLVGPSGHGKSSLINSISSISNDRESNISNSASLATSQVTTVFRRYQLRGLFKNVRVADTAGIVEMEDKQYLENVLEIIRGHIIPNKEFNVVSSQKDGDYYIKSPSESDKIHCVILVVDIRNFEGTTMPIANYKKSIDKMLREIDALDIPRIVVLTHADKMDGNVDDDISKLFYSVKIKEALEKASEALGLPLGLMHPVVNYANSHRVGVRSIQNIPILLALKDALNFAYDTLHKRN